MLAIPPVRIDEVRQSENMPQVLGAWFHKSEDQDSSEGTTDEGRDIAVDLP